MEVGLGGQSSDYRNPSPQDRAKRSCFDGAWKPVIGAEFRNPDLTLIPDKKSIWKCKSKYEGGVRRDVAKKFHHYSGKATGGNVHLFDGVGEDLMKLAFEKDKAGTPPDLFGKLPFGESVLTYFQGGHNAPLVVWRFVLDENVAIKSLNYYINGSVISSTSLFECERIAGQ